MQRIAAYGASVTEQENGYADYLARKFGQKIKKFGYGGMHLPDAGMCFIDDVIKYKPNLAFIDWFSTGYMEISEKTISCLDTILYKFSLHNCAIVFLFMPFNEDLATTYKKNMFYSFLKEEIVKRNANYIDIASIITLEEKIKALRDTIHTNVWGGARYAEIISEQLSRINTRPFKADLFLKNAKYRDIKVLPVNRVFENHIHLKLDGEIIGFYTTIGRHSGLCKIEYDNGNNEKVLLWDRWCHFERKHFDFPIAKYSGSLIIKIIQDSFDTSECKADVDFTHYKKNVACHAIYYIGSKLSIENLKESSFLKITLIEIIRIMRMLKHFFVKFSYKILQIK